MFVEEGLLFFEVLLDFPNRGVGGFLAADKEVGGVNADLVKHVELLSTFWVDGGDAFDFVAPEFHPHGVVGIRQMDVHCVAFDPEVAAFELRNRPAVKACHQAVQQIVSCDALPHFKADHILVEFHGVSNAVDATDARDHNHITSATQQGRGCGESQLFNLIVDLEILLDVGVG